MRHSIYAVCIVAGISLAPMGLLSGQATETITTIIYRGGAGNVHTSTEALLEVNEMFFYTGRIITADEITTYYEDNFLPVNAVLCGEKASKDDVRTVAMAFLNSGVSIMYVGPYYGPMTELSSERNTIDIRSVGDKEFYYNSLSISGEELYVNDFDCGFGGRGIVAKKRIQ